MSSSVAAERHPSAAILRGAGLPALIAVAVVALAGLLFERDHALSALVGGAIGIVALAIGPVLQWLCRNLDPAMALGVAVLAYCLVIGVAGFGYSALNDVPWMSGRWTGYGLLAAILAWTTGQMRAVTRLRQLVWSDASESSVNSTTTGS